MTTSDAAPIITGLVGLLASPLLIHGAKRWLGFRGSEIEYLRSAITRLEVRVDTLERERLNLIERLAHKDVEIARHEVTIDQQREEIESLSSANAELETEISLIRKSRAAEA